MDNYIEIKSCKYCQENTDETLIEPCKCNGSLKYLHKSCLEEWIKNYGKNKCEICKSNYNVKITYVKSINYFEISKKIFFGFLSYVLSYALFSILMYIIPFFYIGTDNEYLTFLISGIITTHILSFMIFVFIKKNNIYIKKCLI